MVNQDSGGSDWQSVEEGGGQLREIRNILQPRIIACVAGAYPGERSHALDPGVARDVISITKSRACIVHIAKSPDRLPSCCIPIDDILSAFDCPEHAVPVLNTSRAGSASEALQMIDSGLRFFAASRVFGQNVLIKLEILDNELLILPQEVLRCLSEMTADLRSRCVPYLPPDSAVVVRVRELGCPAIRIASGKIGERTGVLDPAAVRAAIEVAESLPVILEGGLDSAEDIEECARLGATAVLVNSAFALSEDPRRKARELRQAADRAWRVEPGLALGHN